MISSPLATKESTVEATQLTQIRFTVQGDKLPKDNGYLLFAGINRLYPVIRGNRAYQLTGINLKNGSIYPGSKFTVRGPSEDAAALIGALFGKEISVGDRSCRVSGLEALPFKASPSVRSRHVIYKGATTPDAFYQRLEVELMQLGIMDAQISLEAKGNGHVRYQCLSVGKQRWVGFPAVISGLTPQQSLLLQQRGLGVCNRFGCGVMTPC